MRTAFRDWATNWRNIASSADEPQNRDPLMNNSRSFETIATRGFMVEGTNSSYEHWLLAREPMSLAAK